jgi:hypothetical protein
MLSDKSPATEDRPTGRRDIRALGQLYLKQARNARRELLEKLHAIPPVQPGEDLHDVLVPKPPTLGAPAGPSLLGGRVPSLRWGTPLRDPPPARGGHRPDRLGRARPHRPPG